MSIWQTKPWGIMLEKSKQVSNVYEIEWVFVEKRSLWFWYYGLFVIWLEKEKDSQKLEANLVKLCKEEKALFVQIDTINYHDFSKTITKSWEDFKKWYYKKFIVHHTAIIDLTQSKDDILSWMKPKWRYNIKLAEKKWLKAEVVEKTEINIEKFYELIIETTKRDWFNWNSLDYYKIFLNEIKNSELILVYNWTEAIAWWIFVFEKEVAIYYYWASSSLEEDRKLMAPYLLQRKAIKESKKRWCKLYDFLWAASPKDLDSPLKWVTDFKLKFTSNIRRVSDSYIWINYKRRYKILNYLRKKFKK